MKMVHLIRLIFDDVNPVPHYLSAVSFEHNSRDLLFKTLTGKIKHATDDNNRNFFRFYFDRIPSEVIKEYYFEYLDLIEFSEFDFLLRNINHFTNTIKYELYKERIYRSVENDAPYAISEIGAMHFLMTAGVNFDMTRLNLGNIVMNSNSLQNRLNPFIDLPKVKENRLAPINAKICTLTGGLVGYIDCDVCFGCNLGKGKTIDNCRRQHLLKLKEYRITFDFWQTMKFNTIENHPKNNLAMLKELIKQKEESE